MSFKFPSDYNKVEPNVIIDGQQVDLDTIPDRSITLEEYQAKEFRANTPGSTKLIAKFDNAALIHKVENEILPNCAERSDITYDGALQLHYVPELLARLAALEKENKTLNSYVDYADLRMKLNRKK